MNLGPFLPNVGLIMQFTISTKYFANLIKFLDSMIILLLKSRFQENFMENNAFYVFRYQLIIGKFSLFSGSGTEMTSHKI